MSPSSVTGRPSPAPSRRPGPRRFASRSPRRDRGAVGDAGRPRGRRRGVQAADEPRSPRRRASATTRPRAARRRPRRDDATTATAMTTERGTATRRRVAEGSRVVRDTNGPRKRVRARVVKGLLTLPSVFDSSLRIDHSLLRATPSADAPLDTRFGAFAKADEHEFTSSCRTRAVVLNPTLFDRPNRTALTTPASRTARRPAITGHRPRPAAGIEITQAAEPPLARRAPRPARASPAPRRARVRSCSPAVNKASH